MSTSNLEASNANEDLSLYIKDIEKFKEVFGITDRTPATDRSQGQGLLSGHTGDFQAYLLSKLSR